MKRGWLRRAALIALICVLGLGGYLGWLQYSGNYHQVVAGKLYRSAQVTPRTLEQAVARDGIRSVLNLRGPSPESDWYPAELATAKRLGLTHRDFAMSDRRQMTHEQAVELIEVMRQMPRPLLIHCRAGADRTGLAAALYLAAIEKAPEEDAERQLSVIFGHISVPWLSAAWPMNLTFEDLEPWLGYLNS